MKQLTNNRSNRQSWPIKALTAAVTIGIMALAPANSATVTTDRKPIGDLEIYKAAKPGTASIFMMLDTSGSMSNRSGCSNYSSSNITSRIKVYPRKPDANALDGLLRDEDGSTVIDKTATPIINQEITYSTCKDSSGKIIARTLLARLQVALIELLSDEVIESSSVKDTGSLPDDYAVGMGNYSYDGDGRSGVVLVPTAELTAGQRVKLIEEIIDLEAEGNTPTAHAFAEAGAYMMGTNTYSYTYRNYSGFDDSVSTSKKDDSYISPLSDKECSGNGIYLLTDGQPNGSSTIRATSLMNTSLSGSNPALSINSCTNLQGDSSGRSWGCMASYAALLRNSASNTKGLPIKTATVGFGNTFAGLTGTRPITVNGEVKTVVDCDSGNANDDTRNLCKLGERKGDGEVKTYGDGGFYYTENSEEIAASIVDFSASLVQIINTAPSGTITVPEDPYRAANQLPYAYLPMLDPDIVSTASIWRGNLKKYNLDQGTLFGKGGTNKLYKDVAGNLDENTKDEWQTDNFEIEGSIANNNIAAGGVYAQLQAPSSGLGSVRTLYVEDYTTATNKTPILRKIGVNGSGKPVGFDALKDPVAYSQLNQRRLLSFLGFDSVLTNGGQATDSILVKDLTLSRPTKETKVLGGVVHSKPEAISYGADLDKKGNIINPGEDYVLFGSMDGALHLVEAEKGQEEVAIIPRQMLIGQPEALVEGSTKADIGQPYFGVDAPWLVKTDYTYNLVGTDKKVTVDTAAGKGMFAYGGLRMGGKAFYGMDITKKTEPKMLFTITPQGISSTTAGVSEETGFGRLGQIWSKPVTAKVRLSQSAKPIDVLIFGGGYDLQYEVDGYVPTTSAPAKGNAIYMINAKTGKLLWSTSNSGTTKKTGDNKYDVTSDMINSITGGITVLDRDNDGLMDHLYAADLGGQVFRADFENARIAQFGFTAVSNFSNKGVTRILNAAPTDKKLAYRFYESPVVSFYRREKGPDTGKLFAMVNVISGNRSAPLSKQRSNTYANRVYGIIDNDVTNKDLYKSGFTKAIVNLTESKLVDLGVAIPTIGAATTDATRETKKNAAIVSMIGAAKDGSTPAVAATKNGWYYPLTRFDGYSNVRYNKGIGPSTVINNLLYTTVYNPDKVYGNTASCAAKIAGGSERQVYCLPYGVCMESTSISGTGGFIPAGQGIQELAIGAYNAANTDIKVLIGTTTIADRIEAAKRAKYGADTFKDGSNIKDLYSGDGVGTTQNNSDGSAIEYLFNERYTLQPRAWYERKKQ